MTEAERILPPVDVDWWPILVTYITPVNGEILDRWWLPKENTKIHIVYFVQPEGRETYGDVKLGCFGKASVIRSPQAMEDLDPEYVVGLMGQVSPKNRGVGCAWCSLTLAGYSKKSRDCGSRVGDLVSGSCVVPDDGGRTPYADKSRA